MTTQKLNKYPVPEHPTWQVIDSSKLDTFLVCPRQFFYSYVMGWRSERPNIHLVFGSALHKAIEILKVGGISKENVEAAMVGFKDIYYESFSPDVDLENIPKNPQYAEKAILQWILEYHKEDETTQLLGAEITMPVMFDQGMMMWGKLDSVEADREGKVFTSDVKTTGQKPRYYYDQWLLRLQFHTYLHILYSHYGFEKVKGLRIDGFIMRKSGIELTRDWLYKSADQMLDFVIETTYILKQLEYEMERLRNVSKESQIMEAFPRNRANCIRFNKLCPFHSICGAYKNPTRESLPFGMKVEFWDPRAVEGEPAEADKNKTKLPAAPEKEKND